MGRQRVGLAEHARSDSKVVGERPSARRLVDYLLSAKVEAKLAEGASAQIPLNPRVDAKVRVQTPKTIKPMQVDFEAAAEKWDTAAEFIRDEFTGG